MCDRRLLAAVAAALGAVLGVIEAVTRILPLVLDGGGAFVVRSGPGPVRYLLSTGGPLLLGYWCGRAGDAAADYRRVGLVVGGAGGLGASLAALVVAVRVAGPSVGTYVPDLVVLALAVTVAFGVAGLVGAVAGQFGG